MLDPIQEYILAASNSTTDSIESLNDKTVEERFNLKLLYILPATVVGGEVRCNTSRADKK